MKEENSEEMKAFIRKNAELWWHIPNEKKEDLPLSIVTEYVLNYGTEEMVKELFQIAGIKNVASVFYKNTEPWRRINYFPEVLHYFKLYFQKHVS